MLVLDNTKREQFVTCDRNHYWQFERHLKPNQGSTAKRYGITWHAIMEGFYKHIMEHGWTRDGKAIECAVTCGKESWAEQSAKQYFEDDYRTLENCLRSLVAYISHFNYDEGMLKVTSVEQVFKIKIDTTPAEEAVFPYVHEAGGIYFAGRLDLGIEMDLRPWHVEHKTTGTSITLQESRLHRNPQNIGYTFASQKISEEPPEGCLVAIHHLSAYKSKTTGLYGDAKIDFKRIPQIYTDGDVLSWRTSLLDTANRILENKLRGVWPMCFDNCYRYGRCTYAPLCEQNAKLGDEILEGFFEDEPWDVTESVPKEELIVVE